MSDSTEKCDDTLQQLSEELRQLSEHLQNDDGADTDQMDLIKKCVTLADQAGSELESRARATNDERFGQQDRLI